MILIRNKILEKIMNDRQSNDWYKKSKITEFQQQYDELPGNASQEIKDALLAKIVDFQAQYDTWRDRRIANVVTIYGGVFGDYECIDVPNNEKLLALTARYIEYDGETLSYNSDHLINVDGSLLTVSQGWVQGNYVLEEDDITDFTGLGNIVDIYFMLCFYRMGETVSVELFLREEHEDFGEKDTGIFCGEICHGIIHDNQSITLL